MALSVGTVTAGRVPVAHIPRPRGASGPSPQASNARARIVVLVLCIVAAVAAVAFPFAPVQQQVVTYGWTAADGPAAIPLLPYQPVDLTVRFGCGATGEVLTTVPDGPLAGLRITADRGTAQFTSAGVDLGRVALPSGDCDVVLSSDPRRTTVSVDGSVALTREGDVRPDVAGAFSDAAAGVDVTLVADTRFATSASPIKAALGALCALALLGMLIALGRVDRTAGRPVRLLPRRWWRPRPVDVAVGGLLGLWWWIGPLTVDDGYVAGIVRGRGSSGFVGNAYRWLNAPEAPFSWFYELYHLWSLVSASTAWLRLPSVLLGLLCWAMLSRGVLPRLGARRAPWLAGLAFATWWIPFNPSLRPEPWVALGSLAVYLAVERAVATRRVRPLAVALVLAGATTAVTPAGLMAWAPFLAAGVPLLRLLRRRRDLHRGPLVAVLLAGPLSAVLLMVPDQSLAATLEATRVRTLIGGGRPWFQEPERWAALLSPESFEGSIGRRAAVLLTIVAAAGVLWALPRWPTGIALGPARRLVVGFLLMLASLTLSPTKWTQHFGDLVGIGVAVLLLGLVAFRAAPVRARTGSFVGALAAVGGFGALVLAGHNAWPYASGWFAPMFGAAAPEVAGVSLASLALAGGGLTVAVLAGRVAWARAGAAEPAPMRGLPTPAAVAGVVLVFVLVLQVGGLARVAAEHPDRYTLAADGLATATGEPCGLQRLLSVETDPGAGVLPARDGWSSLDPAQRSGTLPVVVTRSGSGAAALEFAAGAGVLDRREVGGTAGDVREMAPAGAETVRLVLGSGTDAAAVSPPRVPRLTPMLDLLPPGSRAVLDWPVAFLFPCLVPEPLPPGAAALPGWRVGPPQADPSAAITYDPDLGGPFAAPRALVTEQRMATYLRGDPTLDGAQLHRWLPIEPFARPEPTVTVRTVAGWASDGRTRVPGRDAPG